MSATPLTREHGITMTWRPPRQPPERFVFEPRDDGHWLRRHERYNGCKWVPVGSEVVRDVEVEMTIPEGE